MKDAIGAGYTREDHNPLANQLFATYARVQDAKALASVIGEEELSASDKRVMEFGRAFEQKFVGQGNTNRSIEEGQGPNEDRPIDQSLDLGWRLLSILPREELDRVDQVMLDHYYKPQVNNAHRDLGTILKK